MLAAQFESFVSAVIIMATVPLGLACAIVALILTGTSLNAYSQIGLVLLVGVMAKNGILIVEFANQLRDRGLGVRQAIEQAANIRLRPVLMTMICTVLGGVRWCWPRRRAERASARLGLVGAWPGHGLHAVPHAVSPTALGASPPKSTAAAPRASLRRPPTSMSPPRFDQVFANWFARVVCPSD